MKPIYTIALLLFTLATKAIDNPNFTIEPNSLRFTENAGQVADLEGKLRPDILFTAHSKGVKLFVSHTGIHYQFSRSFEKSNWQESRNNINPSMFEFPQIDSTQFYRLDMQLINANPQARIVKQGEGNDYENYYLAHCPNGVFGVKNYRRITYQNIYPNIDWIIYSRGNSMEYDFVVHPGGNPADIKIKYNGAVDLNIDEAGNLYANTPLGELTETAPFTYQGNKQKVESKFSLHDGVLAFKVGNYNMNEVLVIDPVKQWATYYGGNNYDVNSSCATDDLGNIYLSGTTSSASGIAAGGFQSTYEGGSFDAFLVKFSSSGSRLWATYYGGNDVDGGSSCVTDSSGNVYLAGSAASALGIASGGFQDTLKGGTDAFLVKFSSNGSRIWATYYGGGGTDDGTSCAIDGSENVYLAGKTSSTSDISSGGFQGSKGGGFDAFLVKFSSSGNRLWATYYGGSTDENYNSCATDALGNVYLAGRTKSTLNIASGGFQDTLKGGTDAFLVKFSSSGSRLWATYYGGVNEDNATSCATDGSGNVYLAGTSSSNSGITSGGFQDVYGGGYFDAFLVKFSSSGNRMWATYYGGNGSENGAFCATDSLGNVYLAGNSGSTSGIASGGVQDTYGGGNSDAFLVKLSSDGNRLWATYYGGGSADDGNSCAIDDMGNVYLSGKTGSTSDIASGGFQNTYGGGTYDAFLIKMDATDNPIGIKALDNFNRGIILYPNPTRGILSIQNSIKESLKVEVFGSMGQLIASEQSKTDDNIDISHVLGGIYYVYITTTDGNRTVYKIVKE